MPENDTLRVISVSKVKEAAKAVEASIGSDAIDALNVVVKEVISQAAERAKSNKRATIKSCDL